VLEKDPRQGRLSRKLGSERGDHIVPIGEDLDPPEPATSAFKSVAGDARTPNAEPGGSCIADALNLKNRS
jgi:hypothetical protein